jgi:hypothetical protein
VLNVLVNDFIDGRQACYLAYVVASNTLYLVDDAGDAGGPFAGSIVLGNSGSLQNSQCSVTPGLAVGSGNNLNLTVSITWSASFAGDKVIYAAARDVSQNNSGWQPLGVWRVPGGTQTTTTSVVGMSPNQITGLGPTVVNFSFSDTVGYLDLGVENILVNNALNGANACYLAVSRAAGLILLMNDAGTALLPGASLGAQGTLSNSQCTVSWTNPLALNGNNVTITLVLTFNPSFDGNRVYYLAARDVNEGNNTGWHAMGTQLVQ